MVVQPFTDHTYPPHPEYRCFYMCGPSFCSRLVVEKHFETFTTFFPPAPSTAENAPKVKQGKMEKRVTTFFSPWRFKRANGIWYAEVCLPVEKVPEWSLLIVYHCLTRLNPLQRSVLRTTRTPDMYCSTHAPKVYTPLREAM